MTSGHTVTADDIAAFAGLGGNLLRPSFATLPLMSKAAPYALNQPAFDRLDSILDSCERYGVAVVVDPHTVPGCRDDFTTFPDDELWNDDKFHDLAEQLWSYIAERYQDRGPVIAGYDLLNEPAVMDVRADSGTASWNELALRLTAAVRAHDTEHDVIIGSAISPKPQGALWYTRFESVEELPPPPDDKIVISPHMYAPHAFTNQGVSEQYPLGPTYPGTVTGQDWEGLPPTVHFDQAALRDYLSPALAYADRYAVPIYVGEFSAARWTGDPGNRYLEHCLRFFESHGWSWTYHSWREWQGWNAEMNNYDMDDQTQYETTPRLELLKRYFAG
jgi:endoglucanase